MNLVFKTLIEFLGKSLMNRTDQGQNDVGPKRNKDGRHHCRHAF